MARVLIAEDEAHIVRVMSLWLRRNGHEVIEKRNGQEALDALRTMTVDVIISDINMPVLDGIGFVKALREELHLDTPVLMLSARCDQLEMSAKVQEYGVKLSPKPFVPSQLVAAIDRLLSERASTAAGS